MSDIFPLTSYIARLLYGLGTWLYIADNIQCEVTDARRRRHNGRMTTPPGSRHVLTVCLNPVRLADVVRCAA